MVAVALRGRIQERENFVLRLARGLYERVLRGALLAAPRVVILALGVVALAGTGALGLGSEFAPKLTEGALAVQAGGASRASAITASVEMQGTIERVLKEKFPDEIELIFARTGTAEVATDPMGPNVSDTYIMLTPRGALDQGEDASRARRGPWRRSSCTCPGRISSSASRSSSASTSSSAGCAATLP
jgi:cobalt-zinc-cadmium resistance protein CzcA